MDEDITYFLSSKDTLKWSYTT